MGMGGRKKAAGKDGENEKPELKFEANDLMELEFGRLLGEPRQATLAKVLFLSPITILDYFCTSLCSMFLKFVVSDSAAYHNFSTSLLRW